MAISYQLIIMVVFLVPFVLSSALTSYVLKNNNNNNIIIYNI